MRIIYLISIAFALMSCKKNSSVIKISNSSNTTTAINELSIAIDSIDIWVNTKYLHSIEENISICKLGQTRHKLLNFDTTLMELFITSGGDSGINIPMKKVGHRYHYDSTSNYLPIESIEIGMLSEDTLILVEPNVSNKFVKKRFQSKHNSNAFRDALCYLNSHLLLKYNKIDSVRSTSLMINPDSLKKMILNGLVSGHCSDDFHFDGITIENDTTRYYQLQFNKGELILYEHKGRNRHEKLNLDSLPKLIILIENYKN